jgi:hypothetical protein
MSTHRLSRPALCLLTFALFALVASAVAAGRISLTLPHATLTLLVPSQHGTLPRAKTSQYLSARTTKVWTELTDPALYRVRAGTPLVLRFRVSNAQGYSYRLVIYKVSRTNGRNTVAEHTGPLDRYHGMMICVRGKCFWTANGYADNNREPAAAAADLRWLAPTVGSYYARLDVLARNGDVRTPVSLAKQFLVVR